MRNASGEWGPPFLADRPTARPDSRALLPTAVMLSRRAYPVLQRKEKVIAEAAGLIMFRKEPQRSRGGRGKLFGSADRELVK